MLQRRNWVWWHSHAAASHKTQPQVSLKLSTWVRPPSFSPHLILSLAKMANTFKGFINICWVSTVYRQCPKYCGDTPVGKKNGILPSQMYNLERKRTIQAITVECDHFWARRRYGRGWGCGSKKKDHCYGLNCVPLKFLCWHPDPQYLRMWLHLEVRSFFFFWPHCVPCGILVSQPGIEPTPSAVKARSPNHWTAREFLEIRPLKRWLRQKMRSLGWALIQYDWCPYKNRLGHRQHRPRHDHVRTPPEDVHPQVKGGDLRKEKTYQHFDLGLPASRTVRKQISVVSATSLRYSVMAAGVN